MSWKWVVFVLIKSDDFTKFIEETKLHLAEVYEFWML